MNNSANLERACSMLLEVTRLLSTQGQMLPETPPLPTSTAAQHIVSLSSTPQLSRSGQQNSVLSSPSAPISQAQAGSSNSFQRRSFGNQGEGSSVGIQEMRNLFLPYDRRQRPNTPGRSTPRIPVTPIRDWRHSFFCLGGPDDTLTPKSSYKACLQEDGLGSRFVTAPVNSNATQLKQILEQTYPKLLGFEFVLLRAYGGGAGKPLYPVDANAEIPAVQMLIQCRVGLIYIRPSNVIFSLTEAEIIPAPSNILTSGLTQFQSFEEDISVITEEGQLNLLANDAITDHPVPDIMEFASPGPSFIHDDVAIEETGSIEEFRAQTYRENPGSQNIFVSRDDFIHQIIGLYSKDDRLCLKKIPDVIFAGEQGRDVGGLTREFFAKSLSSIMTEKFRDRFVIFEGEADHKSPSQDGMLLRTGVFKAVGRAMVHSFIHTGVAGFGISMAVVAYLCTKNLDSDTAITIELEDISSFEAREALLIMDKWQLNAVITADEREKLVIQAANCGFNGEISFVNRLFFREVLSFYCAIDSRRAQLDDMKQAFCNSGVLQFLNDRPYLWSKAFPKEADNLYGWAIVFDKIQFSEDIQQVKRNWFKEYLQIQEHVPGGIRDLLVGWTAWPYLTDENLQVVLADEFYIHTCFNKIEVPEEMSKEDLFNYLRMGSMGGFGGI